MRRLLLVPILICVATAVPCLLTAAEAGAGLLFDSGYTAYYVRPINYGSDVGDVNGDGHQDLVVMVDATGVIRAALGKGDGTFGSFKDSPIDGFQGPIRLADFNDDSKLDLLIGDEGAWFDSVRVAFGQGDGTFGPAIDIALGAGNVFAGDVNGDGKQDAILLPRNQAGHVVVLLGHGDGTFAAPLDFAAGDIVGNLVLTDANQDGKPDLVMGFQVSSPPNQVGTDLGIALGNGDGTFGPVAHFGSYEAYATLFAGDFNGDSKPDVITSDQCHFGNGGGTFGPAVPLDIYVYGIPDLNDDGRPDLVGSSSAISGSYRTYAELGNGDGTFQAPVLVPAPFDEYHFNFSDFNEDGHVDYVAGDDGVGTMFVHAGHGDGTFGSRMSYATGLNPVALAVADLDGNGCPDVVTANRDEASVSVLLGTGGGALGAKNDFAVGPSPRAVAVGDLNHDGRPDVVTASRTTATVSVLLNAGNGSFGAHVEYATGSPPGGCAIGDFDEDGNLDVVTSDSTAGRISLLRGDGLGGFAAAVGFSTGAGPSPIAAGDINGDGHLDVVTYGESFSATTISVLLGDGQGHFSAPVSTSFPGVQIRAIALGDLNHDGKIDVVASGRLVTTVLLGDGSGAFTPSPFFRLVHLRGLALADLDQDGNLDITGASDLGDCSWVTRGHGDGTFGDLVFDGSAHWDFAPGYGTEADPTAIAVTDMNGDGLPDLVVSASDPYSIFNGVSVLLHVPNTPVAVPGPQPPRPRFALDGLRPNPARADLVTSFTLSEAGPAKLEMFDVSGRRVLSQDVGSLGVGAHLLRLQPTHPLATGVYFLRLTQNRESLVTRACVMR